MSLLQRLKTTDLGAGKISRPAPDMLIEGDPVFTTWQQAKLKDDAVTCGVWEATPGVTKSIKGTKFEFCLILEGKIELSEEGREPVVYEAGDSFVMKPGYVGTWRTIETVRKIYVIVD